LIVHQVADFDAAAYLTIQSAFLTAGQRCTCARRLIVMQGREGDLIVDRVRAMAGNMRVGRYTDEPEPFMGPLISRQAAQNVLDAQQKLVKQGGNSILECKRIESPGGAMLSAGLIDVTPIGKRSDTEIFGPLLQVIRVPDFGAAMAEADATAYGLAAGLLSDSREKYDLFFRKIRAGVVNWNRQTTGASGSLPFGGVGLSGNHHPSGYYAADYCSYPIASLENPTLSMPTQRVPGMEL
jgi:succinylglutamic semialdehyde dehydrogenase